jgi:hypothetical protein
MIPNRALYSTWMNYRCLTSLTGRIVYCQRTYNRLPVPYNVMLLTFLSSPTIFPLYTVDYRLVNSFSFPLDPACPCVIGCCFPPTSSMPTTYPPSGLASTCPASTTCIPPLVAPFTSSPSACKTTVSPFCNLALTKPFAVPLSSAFRPIPRTSM